MRMPSVILLSQMDTWICNVEVEEYPSGYDASSSQLLLSRRIHPISMTSAESFVTAPAVKEDLSNLDDFGRIFRHTYPIFVARCCHVNDHISVQLWDSRGLISSALEFQT
jgi:hypothetical protein